MADTTRAVPYLFSCRAILSGLSFPSVKGGVKRTSLKGEVANESFIHKNPLVSTC